MFCVGDCHPHPLHQWWQQHEGPVRQEREVRAGCSAPWTQKESLSTWSQKVPPKAGHSRIAGLSSAIRRLGLCNHRHPSLSLHSLVTRSQVRRNFHHGNLAETEGSSVANERCSPTCVTRMLAHAKNSSEHQLSYLQKEEPSWNLATDPGSQPSWATVAAT